jgi:transglutaminase-like putative cysteine protease
MMSTAPSLSSRFSFVRPLSNDKADTLLLIVACIAVMAPHAMHLPAWSTAVCILLLAWRSWVTFRGNRMPPRWLLLPVVMLTVAGVYWSYRTLFGREPGVTLLVLLLALKLLEMKAKRDLFVVVFLSFFLILAQFFYSQSIVTALFMTASAILLLTAQLSFQYTGLRPSFGQRLGLCIKIFMLALPLMLVLFILFPRIEGPLWRMPGDANSARSGLSDSMAPGNISKLALSSDIAFRVKFMDEPPTRANLYWRGPVLGQFDGRTWIPAAPLSRQEKPVIFKPHGQPVRYQVTLEPTGQKALFALELPAILPKISDNPSHLNADLQMLVQKPITQRIRYDASSFVDFILQPDETPQAMQKWLQLPSGYNPAAIAYAKRLRSQSENDMAIVHAVLRFFREENFSYTLEPPSLGQHTADEFLFSTRAGFCEHYSSAFVILMRAAGIPARVVTGYQGGEVNDIDGFMTVRQSDAHAWAEVWLKGRGWLRIDPTAAVAPERVTTSLPQVIPQNYWGGLISFGEGNDNALAAGFRTLRHNWEALNNTWNQTVLNYTLDKQKNLLASLGFTHVGWQTFALLLLGVSSLVMLTITLPLVKNRVKQDPLELVYQAFSNHMAQYGYPRANHEGPHAYRTRLTAPGSTISPERKTAAMHFLKTYESIRYGQDSEQLGKSQKAALIRQLKSYLAQCR